jgi:flagellar FliJ protein
MLKQAMDAVSAARAAGRGAAVAGRVVSVSEMRAAQAYLERTEQVRATAELDLARQDAEVAVRREALAAAARDRQAIDKLKERQQADHDAEWARRAQNQLDELALAVHRRGQVAA